MTASRKTGTAHNRLFAPGDTQMSVKFREGRVKAKKKKRVDWLIRNSLFSHQPDGTRKNFRYCHIYYVKL